MPQKYSIENALNQVKLVTRRVTAVQCIQAGVNRRVRASALTLHIHYPTRLAVSLYQFDKKHIYYKSRTQHANLVKC